MKVEVAVLGSQFLMVSVDVKQQELCVSRGGRPGLPVPDGLCGRKATGAVCKSRWPSWAPSS